MSKEELSFEELPDGSKIITIQGVNQFGEKYIRQDRIKCPSVWDALKRLTYTAEELEEFARWCSYMGWFTGKDTGIWWNRNYKVKDKTTAQLRELWEKERGVNTSKPPNSKQQCPTCGSDSLITLSDITYCMNDCCDGVKGHN